MVLTATRMVSFSLLSKYSQLDCEDKLEKAVR